MSSSPESLKIRARQETQRNYFYKLCAIEQEAESLHTPTLDDEQLRSFSIQRLDDLDVDGNVSDDSGPRYFAPFPTNTLPESVKTTADSWQEPCHVSTKSTGWYTCDPFSEADFRLRWLDRTMHFYVIDETRWCDVEMDGRNKLPFFEGYAYRNDHDGLVREDYLGFLGDHARTVRDGCIPHMTCAVIDSTVSGTQVPRSVVITALTLMKRQIRSKHFVDHHTIPVLIITFQHDCAATITQVHFHGNRVFIRQSRPLNLDTNEPNAEAYMLLRWMAGNPIGETAYDSHLYNQDTLLQ
ncbi:hypothetical protein EV356DRAFT_529173 [Viridothelium virens]|uniref:Uncharacterized protein n=1 Tax=Viridothelium virens TaxID=1048519 RepID=A0A6A6HLP1_VIRVR|nr:hypothetical protein EV356DRAFT_529173 [Viridothelium virens]